MQHACYVFQEKRRKTGVGIRAAKFTNEFWWGREPFRRFAGANRLYWILWRTHKYIFPKMFPNTKQRGRQQELKTLTA